MPSVQQHQSEQEQSDTQILISIQTIVKTNAAANAGISDFQLISMITCEHEAKTIQMQGCRILHHTEDHTNRLNKESESAEPMAFAPVLLTRLRLTYN